MCNGKFPIRQPSRSRSSSFNFSCLQIFLVFICSSIKSTSTTTGANSITSPDEDPNGYIAYCPCMGRFGNQADQFLGALGFAKRLNRTLILPPWVEYIPYQAGSLQVPFNAYFQPEAVAKYHRAITMEVFMHDLAPSVWPPEKRIAFCYAERGKGKGCDAKDGNPFGPFWDNFKIDFVGSEFFGPNLHYTTFTSRDGVSWSKYDGENWPVLAFVGAPSLFPVEEVNVPLQEFLVWTESIEIKAKEFIASLPKGRFIGIHLRNGIDWTRACEHLDSGGHLFSSPQCTGYRNEHGTLSPEVCLPSIPTITSQVKRAVTEINATSVFVASDHNHLVAELSVALSPVSVHSLPYASPHVDLAILGKSNLFIGNCVSSFTALVKRERDLKGFPSEFWAWKSKTKVKGHEEL